MLRFKGLTQSMSVILQVKKGAKEPEQIDGGGEDGERIHAWALCPDQSFTTQQESYFN